MLSLMRSLAGRPVPELKQHIALALFEAVAATGPYLLVLLSLHELMQVQPNIARLAAYSLLVFLLFGLRLRVSRQCYLSMNFFGYGLTQEVRSRFAEKLRRLPLGQLHRFSPAELHNIAIQDIEYSEQIFSHLYAQLVSALSLTAVLLGLLFLMNWPLALAVALPLPLGLWLGWHLIQLGRNQGKRMLAALDQVNAGILEYIQNLPLLRSYDLAGPRFERLDQAMRNQTKQAVRMEIIGGLAPVSFIMLLQLGIPLMLLAGNTLLLQSQLELITLLGFMLLTPRLYRPLSQMAIFTAELNFMSLAAARVDKVLCESEPKLEPKTPLATEDVNFDADVAVAFNRVSFSYQQRTVLQEISFQAKTGQQIALVGASGSGKTTLLRLLAGFWQPDAGDIEVLGRSIKQWQPDALLQQISIVFQDVFLFDDSIENNLRAGNQHLSRHDIETACRQANCHDFISQLPEGYQTCLHAGGQRLSGGEKQRLSIARALLKDSPIILLDEATSALDPENEHQIQQALEQLVQNKTVFIIAHKLPSIRRADQILVLDKGHLVEQGQHEALLQQQGLYAQLWQQQQQTQGWSLKPDQTLEL